MKWKAVLCLFLILLAPVLSAELSLDPQYARLIVNSSQKFVVKLEVDIMGTYTLMADGAEIWKNNTRTFISSGKREIPFTYVPVEEGTERITVRLYDSDEVLLGTASSLIEAYVPYNSTSLYERISSLQEETQSLYERIPPSKKRLKEDVLEINATLGASMAYLESGEYVKAEGLADSAEYRLEATVAGTGDLPFEVPELGFVFLIIVLALAIVSTAKFFFSK